MEFILIAIILIYILEVNRTIDTKKFIEDAEPYFKFLTEDDYVFLLRVKYGSEVDVDKFYRKRIRDGLIIIVFMLFLFLSNLNFINIIFAFIIGYVVFKVPYIQIQRYYKNNLHRINLMLPYYLKGLEILIQHYTVPVALAKSIETAPDIFKPGLRKLIGRIEAGDSTVDPYMDFAKEYPVRDSMRMMRLLYRLSLGNQENKQEQLMMFSRTVSVLQNKSREQKYKDRLDRMESQTMTMLATTGGGILILLLLSMMMMLQF